MLWGLRLSCVFAALCTLVFAVGTHTGVARADITLPALDLTIEHVVSDQGIHAWLVSDPTLPFTEFQIVFKGGNQFETPDNAGVTYLMTALLAKGAGDVRRGVDFATAVYEQGAYFAYYMLGHDNVHIAGRFLSQRRAQSLDLLRLSVLKPRFDRTDLEHVRDDMLARLRDEDQDPYAIAFSHLISLALGQHPYGRNIRGTAQSLAALTRDDVVAMYRKVLTKDQAFVVVVGDTTRAQLQQDLDYVLGDLPVLDAAVPPRPVFQLAAGVTKQPFANSPQSVVLFAQKGIAVDDPHYAAAVVINYILGSDNLSGGRLMQELREKRGYTYGVSTSLQSLDNQSIILGQFSARHSVVDDAIGIVRSVWLDLVQNGVQDTELQMAKDFLANDYILSINGNEQTADILTTMLFDGVPITRITHLHQQIAAVTKADANAMIARLLHPDALHFVVVGAL